MSPARLLISSGADGGYFPLLRDTVLSIRAHRRDVAIGILDFGLAPEQRDWLGERVAHLVRPDWDIDFPGEPSGQPVRPTSLVAPAQARNRGYQSPRRGGERGSTGPYRAAAGSNHHRPHC